MLTPSIPEGFPAIMTGLGSPVRFFPVRKFNKIGNLMVCILLLLGALAVFLYGLYITYTAYLQHGAAVIGGKLTSPLLLAIGLLLLGLWAGWSAWSNWNRGVLLYEKGFVIRSRTGVQNWAWAEIASIKNRITRHYTNGIYTGTTHEYTLLNRQNEQLRMNDAFVKVEELANSVEQNVFPLLYEPAAQEYNEGKPLAFGPVIISKVGLHFGKRTIPWDEVKEVSLKRGELKVSRTNGGWLSGTNVPASAIPNLRVLLAILDQVVGLKAN